MKNDDSQVDPEALQMITQYLIEKNTASFEKNGMVLAHFCPRPDHQMMHHLVVMAIDIIGTDNCFVLGHQFDFEMDAKKYAMVLGVTWQVTKKEKPEAQIAQINAVSSSFCKGRRYIGPELPWEKLLVGFTSEPEEGVKA